MLLALWLACASTPPTPTPLSTRELAFEAIPGNGFAIDGHVYDTAASSYAEKAAFTRTILVEVVPDVFSALSMAQVPTEEAPGGFQLQTSPSLRVRGALEPAAADELAAALGWCLVQWSVLVTDSAGKGTGYASVRFDGGLSPELADAFFHHAAGVSQGLGGGYTAFGDELRFLNLRGADGVPYSGLDDVPFVDAIRRAAASFPAGGARVSEAGELGAHLVENDWTAAADGERYLDHIDDAEEPALVAPRAEFLEALEAAGAANDWIQGP